MSRTLQEARARPVPKRKDEPGSLVAAAARPASSGFFSFSYTYTELYLQDGRTRVKARQTRLYEGKLSNEAFEGELGDEAYQAAVRQAQRQWLVHAAWLMRPFSWLPWLSLPKRSDEE